MLGQLANTADAGSFPQLNWYSPRQKRTKFASSGPTFAGNQTGRGNTQKYSDYEMGMEGDMEMEMEMDMEMDMEMEMEMEEEMEGRG